MDEEMDDEILALLEDNYARDILATSTTGSMSVSELCAACDIPKPTAYSRLDRLQPVDLQKERCELDTDGHHYKSYVSTVGEVAVTFDDGTYDVAVAGSNDPSCTS